MKRTTMFFAASLLSLSALAYDRPDMPGAGLICPQGQALTYTIVCDSGSRSPIEEIFPERTPGVAICRIQGGPNCGPVQGVVAPAQQRKGFLVRDAISGGELISVTFGLDRLLDEAPGQ